MEGSYDANIHNDEIANLTNEIHDFCRITAQPRFRFPQILNHLMSFKASNILKYLMDKPNLTSAQTCLHMYLQTHPQLPSIFLNRFLSVISADVQLTRSNNGFENSSLRANVIINNVMPTKCITVGTSASRVANIRQEVKDNSDIWIISKNNAILPYGLKVDITEDFDQTIIREISNLDKSIQEGNRCNGFEADSFITNKIMYT